MKERIELIKELISIVEENELAELKIDFKDVKVDIKKEGAAPAVPVFHGVMPGFPQGTPAPAPESKSAPVEQKPAVKGIPVKSPLSGVFYRSSKPGASPFVNVGDIVENGQTLCIIEAMKLMNEISAEMRGRVVMFAKENSEIASEGETIVYLEPVD